MMFSKRGVDVRNFLVSPCYTEAVRERETSMCLTSVGCCEINQCSLLRKAKQLRFLWERDADSHLASCSLVPFFLPCLFLSLSLLSLVCARLLYISTTTAPTLPGFNFFPSSLLSRLVCSLSLSLFCYFPTPLYRCFSGNS